MMVIAIIVMVIAAAAGFFAGAFLGDAMGGAILFALITGIGCIIRAIEETKDK